jgi:glycosyltransferase involved in cell wall biosynthesis
MKDLSFLVPLYNEEKNIILTIEAIVLSSNAQNIDFEIIIVDDGSTDQSFQVAKALQNIYPQIQVFKNENNLGFARTYFKCLEMSDSKYVMYISSDNDIDSKNLSLLISHLGAAPLVLQYCLNPHDRKYYRFIVSQIYTKTLNIINKTQIQYYNGFNIYESSLIKKLQINEESFAFQSEIVSQLIRKEKFIQVPIHCHYHDESSSALRPNNIMGVFKYLVKKLTSFGN